MSGKVFGSSLEFLGTSDSKGVPRFWCGCAVCQEARSTGDNRRSRSSALVTGNGQALLLDCGPDLHAQLARLGGPFVPDAVIVSHAHNDHLLGLGDLLDYAVYEGGHLPIYAPASVLQGIQVRFEYAFRRSVPVLPLPPDGLDLCGYRVRAFEVPHGANGTSYAFQFVSPELRWVYMTDAIAIPEELAQAWLQDLDLLVLGTSLRDESAAVHATRSVYDVREALALPWAQAARRVLLTHLSHDIDVRHVLPEGHYGYASDGLKVELG